MKNLIFCICLLLCSLAQAQPVSFGGITPGKTTREEVKSLISGKSGRLSMLGLDKDKNDVETDLSSESVSLKDLDGISVTVDFQGDVIYRVKWMLSDWGSDADIKFGLLRKYGTPKIKSGGIRTVTCRNGFGASFMRLQGEEELRWPIKNGVQALFIRKASSCDKYVTETYVIHHVATSNALNAAKIAEEEEQSKSKRKKIDAAL